MNEQEYEKLNDLSVSMEYLVNMIEMAEYMLGEVVCSAIDQEKTEDHLNRLWGLLNGTVELAHNRNRDLDDLLKSVTILKKAPEQ